jgi:hypothetical protein
MSYGDTDSLFATFQRFALAFVEIRAEVSRLIITTSRSPETLEQMRKLARRAQAIDDGIAKWLDSVPDKYRPKMLCWLWDEEVGLLEGKDYGDIEVFPGRVDVYSDFLTASAWNLGRMSRIILASLNIRITAWMCFPIDYRTVPEFESFRRVCEGPISDIIASVPYHFGWHLRRKELMVHERGPAPGFACGQEGPCKALPSLFLLWALTCVKNHDISSAEQRAWAKGRLRFIADKIGLKYAHIANDVSNILPTIRNSKSYCSQAVRRL